MTSALNTHTDTAYEPADLGPPSEESIPLASCLCPTHSLKQTCSPHFIYVQGHVEYIQFAKSFWVSLHGSIFRNKQRAA